MKRIDYVGVVEGVLTIAQEELCPLSSMNDKLMVDTNSSPLANGTGLGLGGLETTYNICCGLSGI